MIFQTRAAQAFDQVRANIVPVQTLPRARAVRVLTFTNPVAPTGASVLGRLKIARVGISAMVFDGTEPGTLRVGLGHIVGTSEPGEDGNIAIAGHRDTFFRPLRRVQTGDFIALETWRASYRYRVSSTEIVDPEDLAILQSREKPELTLITCYPFSYFGHAPKRFIVHAAFVP
ncbi:MAG: class D sortase [Acetobacteraceae bacterium]|nr:class D sortase [Acetobacteraceae bacterium]